MMLVSCRRTSIKFYASATKTATNKTFKMVWGKIASFRPSFQKQSQDGQYFMHGRGITFWLALDAVDESNGAMYYCPGTHKLGLLPHRRSNQIGFSQQLTEYPVKMQMAEVPMPASAGTLLGHHPWTVHRAGANVTLDKWRPALGLTYWAQSCYEDAELLQRHLNYQQQLKDKLKQENRI